MTNLELFLLLTGVFGCVNAFSQGDWHLKLTELYPKAKEKITLTYNPTGTLVAGKKDIKAAVFFLDFKNCTVTNIKLKAQGRLFKGELIINTTAKAFI